MNTANPKGSPSHRGGGSLSIPPGAAGGQPEIMIEVDDSKTVLVITPALVYDEKRGVYVAGGHVSKRSITSQCRTATREKISATGRSCSIR